MQNGRDAPTAAVGEEQSFCLMGAYVTIMRIVLVCCGMMRHDTVLIAYLAKYRPPVIV